MEKHKADGVHLYMELKIPIVGTFTTSMYQKGEKTRLEVTVADSLVITWHDGTTVWIYISPAKEVTIRTVTVTMMPLLAGIWRCSVI